MAGTGGRWPTRRPGLRCAEGRRAAVQFNFARLEVITKVVYYGPGLNGKTTNLKILHDRLPAASTERFTSIATEGERTLYFDFLPVDLGDRGGVRIKVRFYTVPGQSYYEATRRLVLAGADALVFVADSSPDASKKTWLPGTS